MSARRRTVRTSPPPRTKEGWRQDRLLWLVSGANASSTVALVATVLTLPQGRTQALITGAGTFGLAMTLAILMIQFLLNRDE